MYRSALIRGFIFVSASIALVIPCFGRGHAPPRPTAKLVIQDYAPAGFNPQATDHELTSVEIKQLKTIKKHADVLYQTGLKSEKAGDLKNAQIAYYRALLLRQKLYGKDDPGIYVLIDRLGVVGLKQKDWDYSDKCFKAILNRLDKLHGPGDFSTVPFLLKLSQVEEGRKIFPAQIDYIDRALTLQERQLGPNAPDVLATRLRLISATIDDGDWRDADERLKRALEIENGKGKTKTREYLQLLKDGSKIAAGLGKTTEATDFDHKAAELEAELPPLPAPAVAKPAETTETKAPAESKNEATKATAAAKPKAVTKSTIAGKSKKKSTVKRKAPTKAKTRAKAKATTTAPTATKGK